jgi:hypothetical protein
MEFIKQQSPGGTGFYTGRGPALSDAVGAHAAPDNLFSDRVKQGRGKRAGIDTGLAPDAQVGIVKNRPIIGFGQRAFRTDIDTIRRKTVHAPVVIDTRIPDKGNGPEQSSGSLVMLHVFLDALVKAGVAARAKGGVKQYGI